MIAGGWVSYSVFETGNSIKQVSQSLTDNQLPSLNRISELKHWIIEYERVLYEFYATTHNSGDEREKIYQKLRVSQEQIENNFSALQVFSQQEEFHQLTRLFNLLQQHAQKLDQALPPEPYDWNEAREELVLISKFGAESLPHLQSLTRNIEQQIKDSKNISDQELAQMSVWVSAFSSLILLIAVLVGYYIRKVSLESLEKQRLALFVEKNPNPVACINFDGKMEFENSVWCEHYPQQDSNDFVKRVFNEIEGMKQHDAEFIQFNLKEETQFLELSIHKIDNLQQFMIYVEDVTAQEISRQELEFLAYHDALTGLPNLKKLESDVEELISRGNEHPFCLISVGVKRLQLVTTTHGHSVSDALIKSLVIRLQNCLTEIIPNFKKCSIYRFTGAKFEILIAGNDNLDDYKHLISKLTNSMEKASSKALKTSYGQFYLDIQAGYAMFPEHGYSASLLIKNASSALNEVQKHNLKKIVAFDHELAYREQNWYRLERDMRESNFDQEFFVTYQSKVNLEDSQLVGMEALIRWSHPEIGLVSPVDFIPIAEESGIIISLGEWILNRAVLQLSDWINKGLVSKELQIAVNVSPSQLLSPNFVEVVMKTLERHQLPGKNLEIEITEEVMVDDKTLCIEILQKLKSAGISIAMDDFGTGYSSLGYLNKFPLSKLKIDRSFVTDIHHKQDNLAIVRTIIALSQSLGIKVIAEGIESQDEVEVLNQLGCHQGQGYLFSKPLKSDEFFRVYIDPLHSNKIEIR